MFRRIRDYFIYGLLIIIPIFATVFVVLTIVNFLNYPINDVLKLSVPPYFSFLISVLFITVLGLITSNFIGRFFLKWFDLIVAKLPLIGNIYKSSKQIVNAFSLQGKKDFKPVLVEYPRKGLTVLAFLTSSNVNGLITKDGTDFSKNKVSVFIPTTPNPTSGFFVYLDKNDVTELDMTMEGAVKILMSAGVVGPES
tara:strand:- start:2063 stop:2650 length:588 start_codon:yes stop_codon:yes gene_type:complete